MFEKLDLGEERKIPQIERGAVGTRRQLSFSFAHDGPFKFM